MASPRPRIPNSAIFSLYRSYLREIRNLPQLYLQQFFQVKARLDIHTILHTKNHAGLQSRKFERIAKEVLKLGIANHDRSKRSKSAFDSILDLAYGRKGPLRWDIMKPLFTHPGAPLPPRIIPAVEKSRPPIYSPELTALLTSKVSRTTRSLTVEDLKTPKTLPPRADPDSELAKALGRFSKRREVNIRWRFFTQEWKRVLPPLQVNVVQRSPSHELISKSSSESAVAAAGIRKIGLQGTGVHEELVRLAGPVRIPQEPTRRQRRVQGLEPPPHAFIHPSGPSSQPTLPSRWLRRRYRELLGRLPILNYIQTSSPNGESTSRYTVELERNSLAHVGEFGTKRIPNASTADMEWIRQQAATKR